jgi:hypothetical protein
LGVGLDLGPQKLAGDASVRQIETDRKLGVALVDAVAEAHPAAGPRAAIEAVAIDALVEMRFRAGGVRIFVLSVQPISHRLLRRTCPAASPLHSTSFRRIARSFASSLTRPVASMGRPAMSRRRTSPSTALRIEVALAAYEAKNRV